MVELPRRPAPSCCRPGVKAPALRGVGHERVARRLRREQRDGSSAYCAARECGEIVTQPQKDLEADP